MRMGGFDECNLMETDISCWPEYLSAVNAAKALGVSKMELCNILNLGAIETNQEEKRQAAFKLFQQEMPEYEEFKYFNFDKLGLAKVHAMPLLNYAKKHGISFDLKVDGVRMRYAHEHASKDQLFNINKELQKKLELLSEENASLRRRIDQLGLQVTGKPPKTLKATRTKNRRYISSLREKGVGLVRLAYQVGAKDLKRGQPWTNAELKSLADETGVSLTDECFKVFKEGMPDNVVRKGPGAPSSFTKSESPGNVRS